MSDQDQAAADPFAVIRQHATAISTALNRIGQAHPEADLITMRCRDNVDLLVRNLDEYRYFL